MGEATGIAWTDSSFNPWWGCTKVGPGCDHCYAEAFAARFKIGWGNDAPRRYFGDKHWNEPLRWNAKAERTGQRRKVFCASMADVFDNQVDQAHRERLWELIRRTPMLDWQIVTKRIGNAREMLPRDWCVDLYPNVWLIITVVNQAEADRDILKLLEIPAAVHGVSYEPALEDIDFSPWLWPESDPQTEDLLNGRSLLDWIIIGGESKQGIDQPRVFNLDWPHGLITNSRGSGCAVFVKQFGGTVIYDPGPGRLGMIEFGSNVQQSIKLPDGRLADWWQLKDRAGADPSEWPEDLRLREFPTPRRI